MADVVAKIAIRRRVAFKMAWRLFWMATGTSEVGLIIKDDKSIAMVGKDFITWDRKMTE